MKLQQQKHNKRRRKGHFWVKFSLRKYILITLSQRGWPDQSNLAESILSGLGPFFLVVEVGWTLSTQSGSNTCWVKFSRDFDPLRSFVVVRNICICFLIFLVRVDCKSAKDILQKDVKNLASKQIFARWQAISSVFDYFWCLFSTWV